MASEHSILYIDATPTPDYAIRILRAYRSDAWWATGTNGEQESELVRQMNEWQDQRNAILDRAIRMLEEVRDE